MQDSLLSTGTLRICHLSDLAVDNSTDALSAVCSKVLQQITHFVAASGAITRMNAARIFIPLNDILTQAALLTRPGNRSSIGQDTVTIARFILSLKNLVRGKHASVVLSLHPDSVSRHLAAKVAQMSDGVVALESFAGRTHSVPYEFKEFHGFLLVAKIQQYGMIAPFRPANSRYGIKRDRRKLHVEPLHLPPEESRAFGAAGTDAQLIARSGGTGAASTKSNVIHAANSSDSTSIQIHNHNKALFNSVSSSSGHDHSHDGHEHHHHHEEAGKSISTISSFTAAAVSNTGQSPHSATSTSGGDGESVPKMTPLAMKLAAARAARQAGAALISSDHTMSATPISIASKTARPAPPLQPGAACGSGVNSKQPSIDF
jgi:hypothetical protein